MTENLRRISFETLDAVFLQMSRDWLQDKAFRELIMAEPIEKEAQEAWFASLTDRRDYLIWGIKAPEWIGACGLKNIDFEKCSAEYWGYIYPIQLRGVGIGREMFDFLKDQARNIGVGRLWLRVSSRNEAAIASYRRWGFTMIESEDLEVIQMELDL